MDTPGVIQLIAILSTLAVSTVGLVQAFRSGRQARLVEVATSRRVKRLDDITTSVSSVIGLTHPSVIEEQRLGSQHGYHETLQTLCARMDLLLDGRFKIDSELVVMVRGLVDSASEFYDQSDSSMTREEREKQYYGSYSSNVAKLERGLCAFSGAEWDRIKNESMLGKPVTYEKWIKYFETGIEYFDKWQHGDQSAATELIPS